MRPRHDPTSDSALKIRHQNSSSDIPALSADQEPRQEDVMDLEWMSSECLKTLMSLKRLQIAQSEDEGEPHITSPVKDPKDDTKETDLSNFSVVCSELVIFTHR